MIYQESVMRVARSSRLLARRGRHLRKACGKEDRELMKKERAAFVDGVVATGYERCWHVPFDIIEQFADYAFNKSHSFGYGLIAYQTAYLKPTTRPVPLRPADQREGKLDKAAVYLAECRTMGIEVTVPDIQPVGLGLRPGGRRGDRRPVIVFGLSAVRNVGSGLVGLLLGNGTPTARSPTSTTSASGSTTRSSTRRRSSP